jgi:hypothetical protein
MNIAPDALVRLALPPIVQDVERINRPIPFGAARQRRIIWDRADHIELVAHHSTAENALSGYRSGCFPLLSGRRHPLT